mgnify:FL=1
MKLSKRKLNNTWQCYLMISTQIIGLLVFTLYPMAWAVKKAFYYYTGVPSETTYTGLVNFMDLIKDVTYWKTWVTTIQFTFIKLAIEFPLAMVFALILNTSIRGKGVFRAVFYLPNIVSVAIIGLIFGNMFDYFGFVNAIFMKIGIIKEEVYWLGSFWNSLSVLITGSVWTGFGINTLYFLAALSNIPKELYECAYLEGADKFTVFRKITLPLMGPVLQTIILLGINGTLQISDYVIVTTNGAPGGRTLSVMAYQIRKFVPGFMDSSVATNLGYGCAMSIITSMLMCVIALIYNKMSEKLNDIY